MGDDPQRGDELVGRGVLEQEPAGARSEYRVDVLVGANLVSTSTLTPPSWAAQIGRIASMPYRPGIRMSISTTSGNRRRAWSTAWVPSAALPKQCFSSAPVRGVDAAYAVWLW